MRRFQKRQCLKILDTLSSTTVEIKKILDNRGYDEVLKLFEQMQQAAIILGNTIEQSEGEGFVTVAHLENYCELLYGMSEEISSAVRNTDSINSFRIEKKLKKSISTIENSIRNDIPEKTEVVFLPYKASMWDSLESVWRRADADPNCDAYVIPIPYFDRTPDRGLGQMHYEGNLYPKDVPVIDYTTYDFKGRHPDRIYIHNPYDDNNFVTSVHPFFYSKNLMNFTDDLVYIPYFILDEPDPDNESSLEGIKNFVLQTGVFNANHVIVQSEAMREAYIRIIMKYFGFGEDMRPALLEKISGAGSPKVEKVMNTKLEDIEIPEEWLRLIKKPDGSFKKIVFYNTSVSTLLKHNDEMLVKMKDVFRIFKESSENIVLLWRPHPLIQATIESMRPKLWNDYKALVDEYRSEGWGIYDDTPDMDRAVILSDAYYGDFSSIVWLYQKTGKPIMIENPEIIEE